MTTTCTADPNTSADRIATMRLMLLLTPGRPSADLALVAARQSVASATVPAWRRGPEGRRP